VQGEPAGSGEPELVDDELLLLDDALLALELLLDDALLALELLLDEVARELELPVLLVFPPVAAELLALPPVPEVELVEPPAPFGALSSKSPRICAQAETDAAAPTTTAPRRAQDRIRSSLSRRGSPRRRPASPTRPSAARAWGR
jgi:hypothetical protein